MKQINYRIDSGAYKFLKKIFDIKSKNLPPFFMNKVYPLNIDVEIRESIRNLIK